MLQYKTTCIPAYTHRGVSKREFEEGITVETGNEAISPIGKAIQREAQGGWTLHSIEVISQKIARSKGILEILLGWIPLLGSLMFPNMQKETVEGITYYIYVLIFVKEV